MPSFSRGSLGFRACLSLALGLFVGCVFLGCARPQARAPSHAPTPAEKLRPARRSLSFISPYTYAWFMRAELARAHGRVQEAIDGYRTALASSEEEPYVLARLATALAEAGDMRAANDTLEEALSLDPQSVAAWLAHAALAEKRGDLQTAYASYERAESLAPSAPEAPLGLARLLRAQGQRERAIAVLERFEARTLAGRRGALRAKLELALERGDAQASFEAARVLLEQDVGNSALLCRTAKTLVDADRLALAQRLLDAFVRPSECAELGLQVELRLGDRDAALTRLLTTDPALLGGELVVARAYLEVDRPELALTLAESRLLRADDDDEDDVVATVLRGEALLALGRAGEAAESFTRVIEARADPASTARARQGLARALQKQGAFALAHEITQGLEP